MSTKQLISSYRGEIEYVNFNRRLDTYLKKSKILFSKENYALFKKYDSILLMSSLSISARSNAINHLNMITPLLDANWSNVTKNDIERLIVRIMKKYGNKKGQETSVSSALKGQVKTFVRWIKLGSRSFREVGDPEETKFIQRKKIRPKLTKEMLIDDKDRANLLSNTTNTRDRALIDVVLDAGSRAGEVLTCKIKHVVHDKYGIILEVDGKTGPRPIRLIKSIPNLSLWLNEHPFVNDPESPLWVITQQSRFGKPLLYDSVCSMLKRVCTRAKIHKKVSLHLLRHSAATSSATFMNEAELKIRHGWSRDSSMPSVYVHLVNSDVDNKIFKHFGMIDDETPDVQLPKKCSVCDMINPCEANLCNRCARPLDVKTAINLEEKEKEEKNTTLEKLSNLENGFKEMQFRYHEAKQRPLSDEELERLAKKIKKLDG